MRFHLTLHKFLVVSAVMVLTLTACQSPEQKLQKHLEAARVNMESGHFAVARIELLNAIRIDPSSSQAYFLLGRTLAAMKDHVGAARAFASASELAPEDREITLQYARYLVLGKAYDLAAPVLEEWVEKYPEDAEFGRLFSFTLAHRGEKEDALKYARKAVELESGNVDSWLNLAQIQLLQRDSAGAKKAVGRAERIAPDSIPVALMRVSLLSSQGKGGEAVLGMEGLIDKHPERTDLMVRLGGMYEALGRDADAQRIYGQVTQKEENETALYRLGTLLYRKGQKEEALDLWSRSVDADPYFVEPRLSIARHLMKVKDVDRALNTVNDALKYAPQHPEALALRGEIYLVRKKTAEAAADLKQAVDARPERMDWRLWLARAQLSAGEGTSARANLLDVLGDDSKNAEANVLLAGIEAGAANLIESSRYAAAASMDPVFGRQAMWILGDNAMREGMFTEARSVYERNIERHGGHPGSMLRLAQSFEAAGDLKRAETGYRVLVEERPGDILPRARLLSLLTRTDRKEEAVALAEKGADMGGVPQRLLYGRVLEGAGQVDRAKGVYQSLIEDKPEMMEPYQRIVALYARESRLREAEKWLREKIKEQETVPIGLQVLLGTIQDVSGERGAAIGTYRGTIKTHPDLVPVLNNLAWDLAEEGKLKEALEMASKGRKLAPEQPALADTYGWILHRSGDSAGALPVLREAYNKLPDNKIVRQHLVEVLEAVGRTEEAKRLSAEPPESKQ